MDETLVLNEKVSLCFICVLFKCDIKERQVKREEGEKLAAVSRHSRLYVTATGLENKRLVRKRTLNYLTEMAFLLTECRLILKAYLHDKTIQSGLYVTKYLSESAKT